MKNLGFYTLAFVFLFGKILFLSAQQVQPGGVAGDCLWLIAENTNQEQILKNKITGETFQGINNSNSSTAKDMLLNFNPAVNFAENSASLYIPLNFNESSKLSVFTVYASSDAQSDKVVWEINKNEETQLLHTSKRIADMQSKNYLNFFDWKFDVPVLSTYVQYKAKDSVAISELKMLVGNATLQDLPIVPFEGKLAEIILFNRVLSPIEKLKIESYLSLKYGIPLSQDTPVSYYNSLGEIIWDADANLAFSKNIIGIGRDDLSDLYQKQSTNSIQSNFPILGFGALKENNASNAFTLQNSEFILLGESEERPRFTRKIIGQPLHLEKDWMVSAIGSNTSSYSTFLNFHKIHLEESSLKTNETFWLSVDRSGTGLYPLGEVDFFPLENELDDLEIQFSNIFWDTDGSDKDVFTLSKGPEMFPKYWISPPTCTPETTGALHVGVEGGTAPYEINIEKLNTNLNLHQSTNTNDLIEFNSLPQGEYLLTIQDARNKIHTESIFIQSSDALEVVLDDVYTIELSDHMTLNANVDEEAVIGWHGPNNLFSNQQTFNISQPGAYLLNVEYNGCLSQKRFQVHGYEQSNIKSVQLFPNPVEAKSDFYLKVNLHEIAALHLSVTDNLGRTYKKKTFEGSNFYFLNEKIQVAGIYYITFESLNFQKTLKLVVN